LSNIHQTFSRKQLRDNAIKRYEKERLKNKLLATHGEHDFVLVLDNLKSGFNVPKLFRSAEAFGAHEVHLINIGVFDPAPAKGAFRKIKAKFHEDFGTCYMELKQDGHQIFALDFDTDKILGDVNFPEKSAFILGNEELGLSFDLKIYPDIQKIKIQQFGKIQSLNVSIAGSIVMYEYLRQLNADSDS